MFKVSYCDRSSSVIRHARSVERCQQFALKACSSYIPGPIDSKPGGKHQGELRSKITKNHSYQKSKMIAMVAILNTYFSLLSWTERPIDLKLGRKHSGDL